MGEPNIWWAGTPNYTEGNYGVEALFPHWTAGSFDASVSTLQDPNRQASAHYVIEGTDVAQLVDESDSAWHCGNYYYNMRAIAYELVGWPGNPPSYETLDTCARMMAQASRDYFGGAPLVLGENVMLHRWVYATSCPGETDVDWLVERANAYLRGEGPSAPKGVVQMHALNGDKAQSWKLIAEGDYYKLQNRANGWMLDVTDAKAEAGTRIQTWKENGDDAQLFRFEQVGGSKSPVYEIVPKIAPDLRVDIKDASTADGAIVQLHVPNGNDAQRWQLLKAGGGGVVNVVSRMGHHPAIEVKDGR